MKLLRVLTPILIALGMLAGLVGFVLAYEYEVTTWTITAGIPCYHYNSAGSCDQWFMEYTNADLTWSSPYTFTVISMTFESRYGDFALTSDCLPDHTGFGVVYPNEGHETDWESHAFSFYNGTCAPGTHTFHWQNQFSRQEIRNFVMTATSEYQYQPVGGWPACGTVDNADFNTASNWTLGGTAAITASGLDLPATGDSAYEDFNIVSNLYTVTVVAKRTSSDSTDGLIVAIAPEGSGHVAATEPILITNDGIYHTVTATLQPDTLGAGALHIVSNGSHNVDYICLEAAYGQNQCTSTSQSFDFQTGYNTEDNFITQGWGYSQHWRGVNYPTTLPAGVADGGAIWTCNISGECGFRPAALLGFSAQSTIKYDYMVVPHTITVTSSSVPGGTGSASISIFTSPDGQEWALAETQANTTTQNIFNLNYESPVYIIVTTIWDQVVPILSTNMIYGVALDACYSGPNTLGACIVGDPDFDVSDGYPSRFYWDGAYQAVPGAAALQQDSFIAQALTPPWVGQYNLAITGSSADPTCAWRIMFTNYGSGVQVASQEIPCSRGTNAVYNLPFNLSNDPLMVWIEQRAGTSSISRVCLSPGAGATECLNQNPSFDNGAAGYVGQPSVTIDGGDARLYAGYNLAAMGVDYSRALPPYTLLAVVSPRISSTTGTATINNGEMPGSDSDMSFPITTTTSLTYEIAAPLPGNTGPMIWNATGGGDFLVSWYCITHSTTISQYVPPTDPFTCSTVANSSFMAGLDNWTVAGDVTAVNGVATFAAGGQVSQGLSSFPGVATSTVRWLTHAYAPTAITLSVGSDYGSYDFSHSLLAGGGGLYQETVPISGTTGITITSGSSGLELDFVCLYPGGAYLPPLISGTITGTVEIPPGSGQLAQCVAPPMGILPTNLTSTLASLWPWGTSPTYFEILMAYNTAWVRYIGCRLDSLILWLQDDFWGRPLMGELARGRCIVTPLGVTGPCGLRGMLDLILGALVFSALVNAITALATTLSLIETSLGEIVKNAVDVGRTLLYLFGLVGLVIAALIGLLVLIAALILLIWQIPQEFWTSFRNAVTGADAVALPLPTSSSDPLYNIVVGLQLINQVAGATFLYPIVVVSIVVGSIGIFLWTIRQFSVKL